MGSITPFRSQRRSFATPHHMLRALAEIDATLILCVDQDGIRIDFQAPRKAHAEFHAILRMLDRCGDTWRCGYIAKVLQLLDIDDVATELRPGFNQTLKLRTAFVVPFPESGSEAFRLFYRLNAKARDLAEHGHDNTPEWLSAVSRCDDLWRAMEAARGTAFGIEVAAEARRLAIELSIDLGGA